MQPNDQRPGYVDTSARANRLMPLDMFEVEAGPNQPRLLGVCEPLRVLRWSRSSKGVR